MHSSRLLFVVAMQLLWGSESFYESAVTIQTSMVTHTHRILALHLTHPKSQQWTHTQPWTHTRSSGQPIYAAAPGEQLRVRGLAQGHLSRGIEGGESAVHSLPPPTIAAGPETWNS